MLSDKHHKIALMYHDGLTQVEISKQLECTSEWISQVLGRTDVKGKLRVWQKVRERQSARRYEHILEKVFENADNVIGELIRLAKEAKSESVRVRACKDLIEFMKSSAEGKGSQLKLPNLRMYYTDKKPQQETEVA